MTKQEHLQNAALHIEAALAQLKVTKEHLRLAKSDQHIPLATKIAELEEIHDILTDPECTPEMYAVGGSE